MPIKIRCNLETGHVSGPLIIAALCGLLLVVYLIIKSGAADLAHAMLVTGWWLIPITLFHLVPLVFGALSWRELLPPFPGLGAHPRGGRKHASHRADPEAFA
jgi:hypothetical protein